MCARRRTMIVADGLDDSSGRVMRERGPATSMDVADGTSEHSGGAMDLSRRATVKAAVNLSAAEGTHAFDHQRRTPTAVVEGPSSQCAAANLEAGPPCQADGHSQPELWFGATTAEAAPSAPCAPSAAQGGASEPQPRALSRMCVAGHRPRCWPAGRLLCLSGNLRLLGPHCAPVHCVPIRAASDACVEQTVGQSAKLPEAQQPRMLPLRRSSGQLAATAQATYGVRKTSSTKGVNARGPGSKIGVRATSRYRGVTHHCRTGRFESHIWDCGKQARCRDRA